MTEIVAPSENALHLPKTPFNRTPVHITAYSLSISKRSRPIIPPPSDSCPTCLMEPDRHDSKAGLIRSVVLAHGLNSPVCM